MNKYAIQRDMASKFSRAAEAAGISVTAVEKHASKQKPLQGDSLRLVIHALGGREMAEAIFKDFRKGPAQAPAVG